MNKFILLLFDVSEQLHDEWINSADLDQVQLMALHSAVSNVGLHCLLTTVCPNMKSK